jgi:hypothetical protein
MTPDTKLTIEFVDSVFVEMQGNQQLVDQLQGRENAGIQYKLGEDQSTEVLSRAKYTDKAVRFLTRILDSPAGKTEKLAAILWMVVGSIKFGMYIQRKYNDRGGIIQ